MKKESIILFILCILTTNALAQEYHPFVEEGKVWVVDGYVYEMKGDTVYNGRIWKKLSEADIRLYNDGTCELKSYYNCTCFIREENRRIYTMNALKESAMADSVGVLFMDFNVKEGDIISVAEHTQASHSNYWDSILVTSIDRVEYEGLEHQVINMESLKIRGLTFSWVDGLGSFPENPFRNDNQDAWGWGHRVRFTLCMRGDSILYRTEWDEEYERALEVIRIRDEFLSAVSILRLESGTSLPVLSDLQGRRLTAEPQHGVFIKGGKKVMK